MEGRCGGEPTMTSVGAVMANRHGCADQDGSTTLRRMEIIVSVPMLDPRSKGFFGVCYIEMRKEEGVVGGLPEFVLVARRIPDRLRAFGNR